MSESENTAVPSFLETLSGIAATINTIQEPDALLEQVLGISMEALDAERGFVLLTSQDHPSGFVVANHRNFGSKTAGELARISSTVAGEVMRTGEPILVYEALKDDRFGGTESIVMEQIQSIACVPLRIKRRQIGAIYLDSLTRRGRFTRDSLPLLTAIANQAAVAIENARLYQTLRQENRQLRSEIKRIHGFEEIIGRSRQMRDLFETVSRVLDTDASIFIEGESGTGKELVARAIHYNGERKDRPFVAVFCGSLPDDLLESELFGHKRGSFTGAIADKRGLFETAHKGTIFLDEVGDLSARMQTVLLRVLQEGEIKRVGENQVRRVDVRVISATNKPLQDLIKARTFREDLYYRLNTIQLNVPALRQRPGDVPLLANHFLDKYAVRRRAHIRGFQPEAMALLRSYAWPGNVRELENTIERAVVLCKDDLIGPSDLRLPSERQADPFEPGMTLKDVERVVALRTLDNFEGNVSEAARALGVSRRWFHYRLKEWESRSP